MGERHQNAPVAAGCGVPRPGRRALLRLAAGAVGFGLLPAHAEEPDVFATLEAGFSARGRLKAFAAVLGMGRLRPGAATNPSYRQFLADARTSAAAFTALEMRLSRTRPAGIAVLSARPGLSITPDTVRRRYGPANWGDVRPELPTLYLTYPRAGGAVAFGFPRGAGTLEGAVLTWGTWT